MSLKPVSPAIVREIRMDGIEELSQVPESLENGLRYRSGRKLRSCVKLSISMSFDKIAGNA